jgi:ankyrin repeat protein
MLEDGNQERDISLSHSLEDLRVLHQLCRDGRLYDVELWIAEGKPLQVSPETLPKGTRPKTALQIAIETGQHSLVQLLLSKGYRLDLERYAPLDLTLKMRRWDLFDLLLQWGADLKSVDVHSVLETYNIELYERFRAAGYDLTKRHEMGSILGHGTSNRPLLGFMKRHRTEDPKIQQELNIALCYHARNGNEKGINLCLWAGADPHAQAPNPQWGSSRDVDDKEGEERFLGWTAIEEAAQEGHLTILKRLGPDPRRDNFDNLYQYARHGFIVTFLATIQQPKDLTSILSWHLRWVASPFPWSTRPGTSTIEAILGCKVPWQETDPKRLAEIRKLLLKLADYELKTIMSRLKRPDICSSETFQELTRTTEELTRLLVRYNRSTLYEQIWSQPVQVVAKSYGISDVRLGKVCRALQVPVPPRGYWARVRNGYTVEKPPLKDMSAYHLQCHRTSCN